MKKGQEKSLFQLLPPKMPFGIGKSKVIFTLVLNLDLSQTPLSIYYHHPFLIFITIHPPYVFCLRKKNCSPNSFFGIESFTTLFYSLDMISHSLRLDYSQCRSLKRYCMLDIANMNIVIS